MIVTSGVYLADEGVYFSVHLPVCMLLTLASPSHNVHGVIARTPMSQSISTCVVVPSKMGPWLFLATLLQPSRHMIARSGSFWGHGVLLYGLRRLVRPCGIAPGR